MDYYYEIKKELLNNEITKRVKRYSINKSELNTYYNIGQMLSEAGKHYGEGIIKEYAKKLSAELGKSYSVRLLYRMLKYYSFVSSGNLPTASANLSWSHYDELFRFDDINLISYYIQISIQQNLSVRQLREKIKSKEYERLPEVTKYKIVHENNFEIIDFIKSPIIIKGNDNYDEITERMLKRIILEDIESFMKELGESFCFIGSEYKIKIENTYNYIDILLFNIEHNCFVVVELKVTELKKEHIGQIQVYMNYIDKKLRGSQHNDTIGIIICKQDNEYVIKYCSDNRIIAREYRVV